MSEIQWGGELVACVTEGFVEVFGDGAAIGMEAFFFFTATTFIFPECPKYTCYADWKW